MKQKFSLLAGAACLITGVVTLLLNTSISSWGFYRVGKTSTGGILFALLILSAVYLAVKKNKTGMVLVAGSVSMLLLSLILGIHIRILPMSALEMVLICGLIGSGIGLIVKSFLN